MVAQGNKWQESKIAVFFSTKLNPAQQNYPVHEQEMLVGVEGMLRYQDILQGTKFTWLTDYKGLIHLYNQRICPVNRLNELRRSVSLTLV